MSPIEKNDYRFNSAKNYRSELKILSDILEAFKKENAGVINKTRLMYYANLNSRQLDKYFKKLAKADILRITSEGKVSITRKGNMFYHLAKKVLEMLEVDNKNWLPEFKRVMFELAENLGFEVEIQPQVVGESNVKHQFDAMVKIGDEKIFLIFSREEDPLLEFAFFITALIDCKSRGIMVVDSRIPQSLENLTKELESRVSIVRVSKTDFSKLKYILASEILRLMGELG